MWSVPPVTPCIKSILWRVEKRLSYIEIARCLKVNPSISDNTKNPKYNQFNSVHTHNSIIHILYFGNDFEYKVYIIFLTIIFRNILKTKIPTRAKFAAVTCSMPVQTTVTAVQTCKYSQQKVPIFRKER